MNRSIMILAICFLIASSFTNKNNAGDSEYAKLKKLEHKALKNTIGKAYVYDLTHKEGCNKTKIKYLGIIQTKQGKRYKILTSFFVLSAASTCHGTSNIKIFDLKNRYIGEYYVGTPDNLPDVIRKNKLLYLNNSEDCNLRNTRSINLKNGLPKTFFIPCTKNGGDQYSFSSED